MFPKLKTVTLFCTVRIIAILGHEKTYALVLYLYTFLSGELNIILYEWQNGCKSKV